MSERLPGLRRAAISRVVVALLLSSVFTAAWAVDPVNNRRGVALKGYDPVAYFELDEPVKGSTEFEYNWRGVSWRFSSAKHRDLFAADPEKYAPQYGGYCAYAVSRGSTAGVDPHAWTIVDGRLYLNNSASVKRTWSRDIPGNIKKADENWPKILGRQGS